MIFHSTRRLRIVALLAAFAALLLTATATQLCAGEDDFKKIFDGESLDAWDGDPKFWSVEDGAITGQTTKDNPTQGNTFLVWTGGEPGDFELQLEYRIEGGNSGIQYRSFRLPKAPDKWRIGGYQADIDSGDTYSGIIYGEQARGILAQRGEKVEIGPDGKKKVVDRFGDSAEIQKHIKKDGWNQYRIIARGNHLTQYINGVKTTELIDNDQQAQGKRMDKGLLALQLHAGPPMKVQFKNIRLKPLDAKADAEGGALRIEILPDESFVVRGKRLTLAKFAERLNEIQPTHLTIVADRSLEFRLVKQAIGAASDAGVKRVALQSPDGDPPQADGQPGAAREAVEEQARKKIAFIAGKPSHGYGAHEHKAGCMLLAKALNESGLPLRAEVYTGGWPEDPSVLDDADTIVIYADGGGGHPFNAHLEELDALMQKGIGLVAIHYAVEVPKSPTGEKFLDWTGGYFELNWSVNPHWTAEYDKLADHPITRGVEPFSINDEWYYHMRFRPEMQGVTPILSDLPPRETLVKADGSLARPEGGHSNNPNVRKAVLEEKQPQHMAWARERPDGGRGFGFTGGHVHWNWGHNEFRQLVLNAIVWTAKAEVPKDGVPSEPLSVEDLMANQDYPPPENFNPARIQALLDEWNGPRQRDAASASR